jgi:trypsin-like peptidase
MYLVKCLEFVSLIFFAVSMVYASDRLNPDLLKSVLRIEWPADAQGNVKTGGGFLMTPSEDTSGKVFLITNKHMIGDYNYADADIQNYTPWINVFFYRVGDPTGVTYKATRIDLLNGTTLDTTRVHVHPSQRIDLVAIDVTEKVRDVNEHINWTAYSPSYLVPFAKISDFATTITDEVIALGYPLGISSLRNAYPIAKIGYLASTPGEEVTIPITTLNRAGVPTKVTLDGKFLVVDGLIVPGNSGGPVVLVGGGRWRLAEIEHTGKYQQQFLNVPIQNLVTGIVSYALGGGLTAVVSSDYLIDFLKTLAPAPAAK